MEHEIKNIRQLILNKAVKNQQLAVQLLKGQQELIPALSEEPFVFDLIQSGLRYRIRFALRLAKKDKALLAKVEKRYRPLLDFLGRKTLDSLATAFGKVKSIENRWKISLRLEKWGLEKDFHTHLTQQRIQKIDCRRKRLNKIPQWVTQLKGLKTIYIAKNQLKKFPDIWSDFDLQDVSIRINHLETIPPSIFENTNITRLDISYNRLKKVPEGIRKLKDLEYLYLNANRGIDELPTWINELKKLKGIGLSITAINKLPKTLLDLDLEFLYLGSTPLAHRLYLASGWDKGVIRTKENIRKIINLGMNKK